MSSDETATSTRVFVSGLPPSFTSDDLRKHFGQDFAVTDAHILADRRIGFVGLPDHEAAQNVVRYFNKSFIRMSKIAVALARPVDVNRDANGQGAPVSQKQEKLQNAKKRKRELKDDGERQRQSIIPTKSIQDSGTTSSPPAGADDKDFEGFEDENEENAADGGGEINEPVSDLDWLRGRTNRTLDLLESTEGSSKSTPVQQLPSPVSPEPFDNPSEQSGFANVDMTASHNDTVISVPNGRLFVRNLAFSASEGDFETLFASFGKLEEVSAPCSACAHLLRDDFLIGTSYARI
jgi:multiple RNA-binding domain-containing protein 1